MEIEELLVNGAERRERGNSGVREQRVNPAFSFLIASYRPSRSL
jgi:hypothetical protein